MKTTVICIVFVLVICSTSGNPLEETSSIVLRQRRDAELFGNTRKLIVELAENLRNAAKQAINSIGNFTVGIHEQIVLFKKKIINNIETLRQKVKEGIDSITERFQNVSSAVKHCVEIHKQNASALLNETLIKTNNCADGQIEKISQIMEELSNKSQDAVNGANEALVALHNCTEKHKGHPFALGTCLGSAVIQTEIKGAVFTAQSGLLLTRISLAMATLPAALEFCAGARLVEAGIRTTQVIMRVGGCSVSSAFSTAFGNNGN